MRTYDLLRKSVQQVFSLQPQKDEKRPVAIYHASTKPISRSAGRSSIAAAAYRAGTELIDDRTGLVHDYTRKGGVVSSDIIAVDGGAFDRAALWNAAEVAEKRKDARTAREWVVALPAELDAEQRYALARSFSAELSRRYGVVADVCIHRPDREGDNRNHHAHILTTTRQVHRGPAGDPIFGPKTSIELSDTARRAQGLGSAADEVRAIRQLWEQAANRALEQAGRSERIDARSLAAQKIDREPTAHLGPVATEMERRGRSSDRGDGNRQVNANNAARQALTAEIIDLKAERDRRDRVRQVEAMPAAELVAEWDARWLKLERTAAQRGSHLEGRLLDQIDSIEAERKKLRRDHEGERPREPSWIFAGFRRSAYEKALALWVQAAERIAAWKKAREEALLNRIHTLRRYRMDVTKAAERKLQRERPEWAARLPRARAELRAAETQRQLAEAERNHKQEMVRAAVRAGLVAQPQAEPGGGLAQAAKLPVGAPSKSNGPEKGDSDQEDLAALQWLQDRGRKGR